MLESIYHPDIPPFLAELAYTPQMLRLREVGMDCGCEYTSFPLFRSLGTYTRHEHSLGVALIVWHFTQDPVQATAAIFHDIATPCFSHVVDFMRGDAMLQEATEDGTARIVCESEEICAVLRRWQIPTEAVVDYHRYPIADNTSPRLSADRLEYTLGDLLHYGFLSTAQIAELYNDLTVDRNEDGEPELVFRTLSRALAFAQGALRCGRVYVSPEDRYAMQILSEILARALARGVLAEEDLYGTEPELICKLSSDPVCAVEWRRFRALREMVWEADAAPEADRRIIPAKKRSIDPLVLGLGRVSALDESFSRDLDAFRSEAQDHWLCAR
ncbi:MAG: hypothetical protein IK095_04045 [Oscillospiraceae bacterium]|nr:hypothetical protein [Oscillospiraceae bacterium]